MHQEFTKKNFRGLLGLVVFDGGLWHIPDISGIILNAMFVGW